MGSAGSQWMKTVAIRSVSTGHCTRQVAMRQLHNLSNTVEKQPVSTFFDGRQVLSDMDIYGCGRMEKMGRDAWKNPDGATAASSQMRHHPLKAGMVPHLGDMGESQAAPAEKGRGHGAHRANVKEDNRCSGCIVSWIHTSCGTSNRQAARRRYSKDAEHR